MKSMNIIKSSHQKQNDRFPDFSSYGYQIVNELGRNKQGGRITYKAQYLTTNHFVAIKRFAFHTTDWEGLKEIEREISVLKGLNHSGIPKYLDTFQHEGTVCLVQEYINAPCLTTNRSYQLAEIETITLQCLEILVYIQAQTPPIIHRDLKLENILFDEKTKTAYLIDFGFARVHNNESIAISSMALGTFGFMPPEALANKLNLSSDLYSLGVTLICLLCGISSTKIGSYIDDDCQINAKILLSNIKLPEDFASWLQKLVSRKISLRYTNASLALQSFRTIIAKKHFALSHSPQIANTLVVIPKSTTFKIENKKTTKKNLTKKILISTASIALFSFPLVANCSDSYFGLTKQLQENYLYIQGKVNLKDCYKGIYDAYSAETLTKATAYFETASSCLNLLKYPVNTDVIQEQINTLFTLKKTLDHSKMFKMPEVEASTNEEIAKLKQSLAYKIIVIQSNVEFLSSTREEMNRKIIIFSYGILVLLTIFVVLLIGCYKAIKY